MQVLGIEGIDLKVTAKRSGKQFLDDDMASYAAALSYHALLALFPFLIFILTFLGAVGFSNFFNWLLDQAQMALPSDAYQRVEQVVNQVRGRTRGGLLSVGFITSIWVASSGMRALMNALNVAYDLDENRPIWKRYPLSIIYTIGLAVLLILAAALMLLGPQAFGWISDQAGFSGAVVDLWTWLRWPLAIIVLMLIFAMVYNVAPAVDQPFRFISVGSIVAVIIWVAASIGFSYYVSNFGNYNATYGSLGGIIILLIYFFISAAALLLGAEINAVIFHMHRGEDRSERKTSRRASKRQR